jgi:type I restriction enzyme, S subunit
MKLRRVVNRVVDGPHHSPTYVDHGIPFLSARNIKVDRWNLDDAKYVSDADYEVFSRRIRPEVGDVLYTKGGTTGVARAVDLSFPFQVWVHVAVLKIDAAVVDATFLALALNSPRCYEQSQLLTRGATNQDLGLSRMQSIVFCLPPTLLEQREIVEQINRETKVLLETKRRAEREIQLLREYCTRLITDVVTGKLDVREAQKSLPEETMDSQGDLATDEAEPEAAEEV